MLNTQNYTIVNSENETETLMVQDSLLKNQTIILLTTEKQIPKTSYLIHINNVRGIGVNPIPTAGYAQVFLGYGAILDTSAPEIVYPPQGSRTDMNLTLIWELIPSAESYTLEIATNHDFSPPLLTTQLDANMYSFTASQAITHYWRVRADITEEEVPIYSFDPLDYIYVWGDSLSEEPPTGTQNKPFTSIQEGIMAGKETGKAVLVAAVENAYTECISLIEGVHVRGGHTHQDWTTRDSTNNPTYIQANGALAVTSINIKQPTEFQGFVIQTYSVGTTYGMYTSNSSSDVVVSDCIIQGADCDANCIGVYAFGQGNITITDCEIHAGSSTGDGTSIGIDISDAAPTIQNNTIISGDVSDPWAYSTGIHISNDATPLIIENQIASGYADSDIGSLGLFIEYADPTIQNNTITAGGATKNSIGIKLDHAPIQILNNSITGGDPDLNGLSYGINNYYSNALIQGNVIKTGVTISGGSAGIISNYSSPQIIGNRILCQHAEDGYNRGIYIAYSASEILMNVITSGDVTNGSSTGILTNFGSGNLILNNTVGTGSVTGTGTLYGIKTHHSATGDGDTIINNIIWTMSSGAESYGIYETAGGGMSDPKELQSNLIFHVNASPTSFLYYDDNTTDIDDNSADDAIDTELGSVTIGTVTGNLTFGTTNYPSGVSDLTVWFEDPLGSNDDPWDDYALKTTHLAIDHGLNIYNHTAYGEITTDILGKALPECVTPPCKTTTPPWDMGAYSY